MTDRIPQRETVVGVFSAAAQAEHGIAALQAADFALDEVGILMRDPVSAAQLAARLGRAGASAAPEAPPGAITATLVRLGVPEHEARVYEDHWRQGRILVTVKAGKLRYHAAWDTLRTAGAEWIDFQNSGQAHPAAGPPAAPAGPSAPNQSEGPGAGPPVRHIPTSNASPNGYTGPRRADEFNGHAPYVPAPGRPFEQNR